MKVRMNRTTRGSPDGIRSFAYQGGEIYDERSTPPITPDLARVFLNGGLAEEVKVVDPVVETKAEPEEFLVAEHSVGEVVQAVHDGIISAEEALAEEAQGRHRSTLMGELQRLAED